LFKTPEIRLRSRDARFMAASRAYLRELAKQVAPLQVSRGGPIILVQVENEYGSWGSDAAYLEELKGYLKEGGLEGPFFATDLPRHLKRDYSTNLFSTINFGEEPQKRFAELAALQSSRPQMCQEFFSGWYDYWGRSHARVNLERKTAALEWMLKEGKSVSLYMVHGGTTFGFYAGANEVPYRPASTSYDYDAPISEAGWVTPKYQAFREIMMKHLASGETIPEAPAPLPVIEVGAFELGEVAPLLGNLPKPRQSDRPRSMEYFDQGQGCILYQTEIPGGGGVTLVVKDVHDFCHVFMDDKRIGIMERNSRTPFILPERTNKASLKLLVEAMGRINYGSGMDRDRKGITERVYLQTANGVRELQGWGVCNLPFDAEHLKTLQFRKGRAGTNEPALYRGSFEVPKTGDTFLDLRGWGRGVVWVNGHNLGRFWRVGPQQTLYCPGPWLKPGRNEILVLDMFSPDKPVMRGLSNPVLSELEKH
jgi:beta-galactosidase